MNKQLLKKIYSLIFPIAFGMIFSASANAQIVYTDVNPDVLLTCIAQTLNSSSSAEDSIDINNDGVFDLKLSLGASIVGFQNATRNGFVKATPLNGSSILRNNSGYPLHLYRNDSIIPNSNWSAAPNQILKSVSKNQMGSTVTGNWTPPIDGFLGIKIVSGGQTHYGWIRLNVSIDVYNPATAFCTYKEFAYNSIPNQPILAGQASATVIIAPFVNIPDAAFKSELVNNAAINTDIDREIQVTEATAFTGLMTIFDASISNLTGLEAFTAIDSVYCLLTAITSLDVTANTALVYLSCRNNNQLTSIDVTANTALVYLNCRDNQLTSLDVSGNTALTQLECNNNQLTSINISSNAALTWLDCAHNQLTSLDVSSNMTLSILACDNNQLTSLNVKNGNNANFSYFDAASNPNLTCIQVDNVFYSNANWSADKDAAASFSTNCGVTAIPTIGNSANFQIFPNPATNHLTIILGNNIKNVEVNIFDLAGKIIYSDVVKDTNQIEVSTIDFTEGVYLVQIQAASFKETRKLIIAR